MKTRSFLFAAAVLLLGACGGGGGSGITPPSPPPPPPPPPAAVADPTVVAGSAHSCGLSSAGVASCWGRNDFGQLGNGSAALSGSGPVAGNLRFKTLSANGFATCGITLADKVYCWGMYRPSGQILHAPVAVLPDLSFQSVSVGTRNVCALTTLGEAWCWGENTFFQLGLGPSSTAQSEGPGAVAGGLRFTAISAGYFHTCAIDQLGRAWCWGANDQSQLGVSSNPRCDPGFACSPAPLLVDGGLTFTAIAVGAAATCAVASDARLFCWGSQLPGFYAPVSSGTPAAVPGAAGIAVRKVSFGINSVCVLSTAGAVLCMGGNESGQLGRGGWDAILHHELVPVSGDRAYASVSVGVRHACATQADGAAYCWGSNAQQQLGSTPAETCQSASCSSVPARVSVWSSTD